MRTLLTIVLILALPATAQAKWRAAVPLPPHWPTVIRAACPAYGDDNNYGCAYPGVNTVCQNPAGCVFLPNPPNRYDRMHELGHVFDAQVLTDTDRARFTRLLGLGSRPWQKTYTEVDGSTVDDIDSPNEWFADAYAHCAMKLDGRLHHGVGRSVGAYFQPGPRQYDRLCAAIRFVALASSEP